MKTENQGKQWALVITQEKDLFPVIKGSLRSHDIEIDTTYEALSSVKAIQKSISKTGNTVFVRKAFSRMLDESGPPFCIILDYKMDLGLDERNDPDQRKLLRTMLISFIIQIKKEERPDIHGNFLLIIDPGSQHDAVVIEKKPAELLSMLRTNNEDVNQLIDELRKDVASFANFFQVGLLPRQSTRVEAAAIIGAFIQSIQDYDKPSEEAPETGTPISPASIKKKKEQKKRREARILYRTVDNRIFLEGREVDFDSNPAYKRFAPGEFFVIGSWDSMNQNQVAEKIRSMIDLDTGSSVYDDAGETVINLCKQAVIDTTTVSSLVKLFLKDLEGMENKRINVNFKNANILEKSTGYNMIKKYVRHIY